MAEYLLSFVLLLLAFLIKLTANREISKPHLLAALAELPVDIMFLSTALTVPYMKLHSNNILKTQGQESISSTQLGLEKLILVFVIYLMLTIFISIIWRVAERFFRDEDWLKFNITVIISYIISGLSFLYALKILGEVI